MDPLLQYFLKPSKKPEAPAGQPVCNAPETVIQEPCTALAVTTLVSAVATIPVLPPPAPRAVILAAGATPAEEAAAREKARFVEDVFAYAAASATNLKDAAPIVATLNEYPSLTPATGKNLLAGDKAYLNYRSWAKTLGRQPGTKLPAVDSWRNLLPKYRGARPYVKPGDARFWNVFAGLFEHPNQHSLKYAYKLACMSCQNSGITDIPTFNQVDHHYDAHVDKKSVLVARMGAEWARNNICGYIERDAPQRDGGWFGDHHVLDLGCRVWDQDKCDWRPERPWLTAWLDWGTLTFVGWQMRCLDPNRDSIERSLRGAIRRNGNHAPIYLYIDNGADYKAKGFTRPADNSVEERESSIAAALGCKVRFAIAYNARAKVIERMFGEVCTKFSKWFAGYRGSNPSKRPGEADYYWTHPEELPTLDEVSAAFEIWLAQVFHVTASNGKILAGKTPAEARAAQAPARPALDDDTVYKAFLRDIGVRTIMRGGYVRALGREYKSEALWSLQENETVRVKVDTDNVETAWIFTRDNREIGPASVRRLIPGLMPEDANPETIEEYRRQMADQRRQLKQIKSQSAERRNMTRFLSRPPAAEDLARRITGDEAPARRLGNAPGNAGVPPAPAARPAASPEPEADEEMIAKLEALLRQRSRETLDAGRYPADDTDCHYDADDLDARLAAIERAAIADQELVPF